MAKKPTYEELEQRIKKLKTEALANDRLEEELEKYRDHLEELAAERTKDLQNINEKLRTEITERKQAEEALRKSEGKYRDLVENANSIIMKMDTLGNITLFNEFARKFFDYSEKEIIGSNVIGTIVPSIDSAGNDLTAMIANIGKHPEIYVNNENENILKNGMSVWVAWTNRPIFDEKGNVTEILCIGNDITERKQAEDALRESEEKYKSIFENVAVSIILIDAEGQMLDINPYHMTHIGKGKITKENLRTHNFFTYPSVVSGGISEEMKGVLEGKLVDITEHYLPTTSGGTPGYFNTRGVPLFANGEVTGAVIMFEDISKTKRSEELIRDLSHQIIKSQENERQTISLELHDRVAQDLSALKISCEMLLGNKSLSSEIKNNISGISGKLNEILKAVRDLSYNLRPHGLEKLGLAGTLNRYCKDFSRKNGVNVEFLSAGMDNLQLKFEAKINLYRLVQEGLNNIRKHADASNVYIKLISSFPNIILRIEDDGKGFDTEERLIAAYKEKRMGIRSMKERVGLLQGKMHIKSIPGKGTKILVETPYKEET